MDVTFRKIRQEDNKIICQIIREAMSEFGGNRPGTAYYDADTEKMFEAFQGERAAYFVAEMNGKIVGGGGTKHLANTDKNIAELQKVYLLKKTRGLGVGKKIVELCIDFAKQNGYEAIYLETFPNMLQAQKLYKKLGFEYIDEAIGYTGHNTNEIWMLKKF